MTWTVLEGDCIEQMQAMEPASVDAVVTDPPYGLEFMGKEWDRLNIEKSGNPALMPSGERNYKHDGRNNVGGRLSRTAAPPTPKKNPRCRGCGRLRFTATPCVCANPDWDTRTAEFGHDMQTWHHAWATEALRVLRPGGHLLAFGGTRTYHRLACALEDAGFEIRDCLAWLYGSGFPKSLDVSKAIDKAAGAEREVVGARSYPRSPYKADGTISAKGNPEWVSPKAFVDRVDTVPSTPDAQRWQGWGTALKPSHEPVVLARKPLAARNVAANVLEHGTGALNIDGTRIENTPQDRAASMKAMSGDRMWRRSGITGAATFDAGVAAEPSMNESGRWPANVILDPEAAAMLDEQTGELHGATSFSRPRDYDATSYRVGDAPLQPGYGDTGGASRFFRVVPIDNPDADLTRFRYVPKADREERNRGLEHLARDPKRRFASGGRTQVEGEWVETHSDPVPSANHHPTVKPVALMQWLCRLVTPPGGTVLDPFTGSGSTGIAALREGFTFIGIEREPGYVEIARARIEGDAPLFNIQDAANA